MMKKFIVILFFPLQIFAQDITGLWTGTIHTSEKDLPYELAISESNGTFTGFSHTTFMVNGIPEVGVKAVTIKKQNKNLVVEDEALVFNDFSEAPAKGVRQSDFLTLIIEDTVMMLNGTFKTNKTRIYRPVTGSIQLKKIDTSQRNRILPKLDELNLKSSLSFLQPKIKEPELVKITNKPDEKIEPVFSKPKRDSSITSKVSSATVIKINPDLEAQHPADVDMQPAKTDSAKNKIVTAVAIAEKKQVLPPAPKPVITQPVIKKPEVVVASIPKPAKSADISAQVAIKKSLPTTDQKEKPVIATVIAPPTKKELPVAVGQSPKPNIVQPIPAAPKALPVVLPVVSAADVNKRKTETIENVYYTSDSVTIILYDNGEVDGDTVSVVLNGNVILSHQGLSTNPITKTIYTTNNLYDSLQLIMYAENLGSIPPNTGLLILQDGAVRHEIRFAGDFQKNSAILLRRKKTNNLLR